MESREQFHPVQNPPTSVASPVRHLRRSSSCLEWCRRRSRLACSTPPSRWDCRRRSFAPGLRQPQFFLIPGPFETPATGYQATKMRRLLLPSHPTVEHPVNPALESKYGFDHPAPSLRTRSVFHPAKSRVGHQPVQRNWFCPEGRSQNASVAVPAQPVAKAPTARRRQQWRTAQQCQATAISTCAFEAVLGPTSAYPAIPRRRPYRATGCPGLFAGSTALNVALPLERAPIAVPL